MMSSLRPSETPRDALNEWGKDIVMFRDKCAEKTEWKELEDD
jgi:hypothetical protein